VTKIIIAWSSAIMMMIMGITTTISTKRQVQATT
jgi:hypothetical protein